MEGGALRVGLGCGEDGGVRPTLVWYLRGAGAAATEAWEAVVASAEPTAGLPGATAAAGTAAVAAAVVRAAAVAVVAGAGAAAVSAGSGLGLDPPVGGGEEWRTWGLKL